MATTPKIWRKLNGQWVKTTPDVSKGDVGLGNVENFTHTNSATDGSSSKYATGAAVKQAYDHASTANVYIGTSRTNTEYPIGTTLVAWTGNSRTPVNTHVTAYTTKNSYPNIITTNLYRAHARTPINGTWATRGYVNSVEGPAAHLIQRIA